MIGAISTSSVAQQASLYAVRKTNDANEQQGDAAIALLEAAAEIARQQPKPASLGVHQVDLYA